MTLSKEQVKLLENSAYKKKGDDKRIGSKHKRFYRGHLDVQYGPIILRFYPVKRWPETVGVVYQTLDTWLKQGTTTAYTMMGMHVMSRPEMLELRDVCRQHNVSSCKNTTLVFLHDAGTALLNVRTAMDCFKKGLPINDHRLRTLIESHAVQGDRDVPPEKSAVQGNIYCPSL